MYGGGKINGHIHYPVFECLGDELYKLKCESEPLSHRVSSFVSIFPSMV